jgi:hypothetical protein
MELFVRLLTQSKGIPLIRMALSSAYPTVDYWHLVPNDEALHQRGGISPCGHSLSADTLMVSPDNVVIMVLLFSTEIIHLQLKGSTLCLSATCFIKSNKVPSSNAPWEIYFHFTALSMRGITL